MLLNPEQYQALLNTPFQAPPGKTIHGRPEKLMENKAESTIYNNCAAMMRVDLTFQGKIQKALVKRLMFIHLDEPTRLKVAHSEKHLISLLRKHRTNNSTATEVSIMRKFKHSSAPSCIPVYICAVPGLYFVDLVMEYVEHSYSLEKWLREPTRTVREIMAVYCQLIIVVEWFRRNGCIHSDMHGENVLLRTVNVAHVRRLLTFGEWSGHVDAVGLEPVIIDYGYAVHQKDHVTDLDGIRKSYNYSPHGPEWYDYYRVVNLLHHVGSDACKQVYQTLDMYSQLREDFFTTASPAERLTTLFPLYTVSTSEAAEIRARAPSEEWSL